MHLSLMYTADNIIPVLPIKHLVNQDGEPNTPHRLATGTISNLRVFFCPCVVRNVNAHVDTEPLNMCHQSQKGFHGIFVGRP